MGGKGDLIEHVNVMTPHNIVEIHDAAVGCGNQHADEVDQVENITKLTVVSPKSPPLNSS